MRTEVPISMMALSGTKGECVGVLITLEMQGSVDGMSRNSMKETEQCRGGTEWNSGANGSHRNASAMEQQGSGIMDAGIYGWRTIDMDSTSMGNEDMHFWMPCGVCLS